MNHLPEGTLPADVVCRVRRTVFPDGSSEVLGQFITVGPFLASGPQYPKAVKSSEERALLHRNRAESRARRELRWALCSIGADRILTLTYRENMQDLERARSDWKAFVRLVRGKYPGWCYAVVLELQERGAIHFHAGVAGWQDVNYLRSCWLRVVGPSGGNIDVAKDRRRFGSEVESSSVRRIAGYLAKYLGKAFSWMPKGSRRFVASEDRPRPTVDRWWLQVRNGKGETVELLYRSACGSGAAGVGHWLSADGEFYSVFIDRPPTREPCPF